MKSRHACESSAHEAGDEDALPIAVLKPSRLACPFVFASPHSGRRYPRGFLSQSALDPHTLRASEDAHVDDVFADAPKAGAPLLTALFPRAYLDANRDPWELDPALFDEPLPIWAKTKTPRVAAGLGVVPRIVADGAEIYAQPITLADAETRVRTLHRPYHRALDRLLAEARAACGASALIDCHSMPSQAGQVDRDSLKSRVDIVLGDRYGTACAPALTAFIEDALRARGYKVARNAPYAGGWTTERYGRPAYARHAVQIEINRALYLDEARLSLTSGFASLKRDMSALIEALVREGASLINAHQPTANSG